MGRRLLFGTATLAGLMLPGQASIAQTTQIAAPTSAAPALRSEPGMSVRLAGRYRVYAAYAQSDGQNASTGVAGTDVGSTSNLTALGGNAALNAPASASVRGGDFDLFDYARLWIGMDGMAENGLRYGASLEIRAFSGANARGDSRVALNYRRMFGYLATPTLGQLRFGSGGVRAVELMHTGHIMGSIASGLWDGDLPGAIVGPGTAALFWYSASGGNNMTALTWLSPQVFGFDLGVSYAPNNGNFGADGSCAAGQYTLASGGANCDRLNESNLDSQAARPRNIVDLMLRYRGNFGPVGVSVSGGGVTADSTGASGNAQSYRNIWAGILGAQATVAGITVGGIISGGAANYALTTRANQAIAMNSFAAPGNATTAFATGTPLQPLPTSGNNDNLFTWQIGIRYEFGPFTVGTAYHQAQYEGSLASPANARDEGLGIGGSYAVAPGLNIFLEYLYGTRKEDGVNLKTGQLANFNSKATSNTIGLGVAFNW